MPIIHTFVIYIQTAWWFSGSPWKKCHEDFIHPSTHPLIHSSLTCPRNLASRFFCQASVIAESIRFTLVATCHSDPKCLIKEYCRKKKRRLFLLKGLPKKGRRNSFRCPVFWCVTNAWAFVKQIQKISKLNLSKRHKVSNPFLPNQLSWPTPSSVASPASRDRCFPLPRRLPPRPACAWASLQSSSRRTCQGFR